ncbi:MAG: hypothetical protein AAB557_00795 [Patescibacteria group bacterium]
MQGYIPRGIVAVSGKEDADYLIQVYELIYGHTATFNWYNVDKATGDVRQQF